MRACVWALRMLPACAIWDFGAECVMLCVHLLMCKGNRLPPGFQRGEEPVPGGLWGALRRALQRHLQVTLTHHSQSIVLIFSGDAIIYFYCFFPLQLYEFQGHSIGIAQSQTLQRVPLPRLTKCVPTEQNHVDVDI